MPIIYDRAPEATAPPPKKADEPRKIYPPGQSALLPLPREASTSTLAKKWISREGRQRAQELLEIAQRRTARPTCLPENWKDSFLIPDEDPAVSYPAPPGGFAAPVAAAAPVEPGIYGSTLDPDKRRAGATARAARAAQFAACERERFPKKGDTVEVHNEGVWRKGTIRAVKPAREFRNRPAQLFYDVHLTAEKDWLPDELAHFRRIFRKVDADRSGAIDQSELKELLVEVGHPAAFDDDCVAELFRRTDKDGSGGIDFDEFCDLIYVELFDDIGLPHTLYDVPLYKLRFRPWRYKKPADVYALDFDPFTSIIALEKAGAEKRRRAHRQARIDTMSRPLRPRAKAASNKSRNLVTNTASVRAKLAKNIFDPSNYDEFSVARRPAPEQREFLRKYTLTVKDGFRFALPPFTAKRLLDGLSYPLETTSLHRKVHGSSKYSSRSVSEQRVAAPSSLATGRSFAPPRVTALRERRRPGSGDSVESGATPLGSPMGSPPATPATPTSPRLLRGRG